MVNNNDRPTETGTTSRVALNINKVSHASPQVAPYEQQQISCQQHGVGGMLVTSSAHDSFGYVTSVN